MKNYSILKVGHEYVVQADERSILKVASRRRAVRLITRAAELLGSQTPARMLLEAPSSTKRDPRGHT